MLQSTPSKPPPLPSAPSFASYLYFLLAALEKLPKEAECLVYRGIGPEAMQAVFTPACTSTSVFTPDSTPACYRWACGHWYAGWWNRALLCATSMWSTGSVHEAVFAAALADDSPSQRLLSGFRREAVTLADAARPNREGRGR